MLDYEIIENPKGLFTIWTPALKQKAPGQGKLSLSPLKQSELRKNKPKCRL